MRDDVVRVAFAETGTFEKVHNICFACALLVQAVLVLLQANSAPENDFLSASRESVVTVVEDDLDYSCGPE